MRLLNVKLLSAFLLCAAGAAYGQSDVWKKMQGKFPGEPAVYVERSEVLNLVLEGDSIKAWSDLMQDMLHLKDQSDVYSDKRIYGSSFREISDIKAKTLVWDKNRYKEMNVTNFKKNDSRSDGVFYDDSYYYSFDFPSVESQSRTLLEYRENVKDVRFVSGYMMQSNLPHALSTYTIKASKGIDVSFKVINDKENRISFQKTEKGGFVYYQWTAKDLPALDYDSGSPSLSYFSPFVECHIRSYTTKKGTTRVLSDLTDLHRWYNTFVKDLNKNPSPELTNIVNDIKSKSKTEADIVKNVFYWVQDNIQYIAFEQGMRGLIPHSGSYVCEKRYGDCKDMANLIVTMSQMAGVNNVYHTWIGTRDLPYRYTEFPTPIVDNHMIATYVPSEGKYIFLDGTGSYTKYGLPSSMIQGKEAFINLAPDKYEVKVVPEIAPEESGRVDSVKLKIEGNKIVGSGKAKYYGFTKVFSGYDLDRGDQEGIRNGAIKLVAKGSNKFNLRNYQIANLANQDLPNELTYEFDVADYFQTIGDETYINLDLTKDFYNASIKAERKTPKESEYKYEADEIVELQIPEGLKVEYLPPNAAWAGDLFALSVSYTETEGKVVYRKKIKLNYLMMTSEQFPDWNKAVKAVSEASKESIVLKKK
ncbi:MAG TPA: transglutaminase-like domain-containing protein [Cyclobacteriaceae bacterium]|nr:transglutaminase-like domain-containing protein [Cyclobacteriaceae bacterium]